MILALACAQSDTCPLFGTDQSTSLARSRQERVFLNFEAPSQCRGNVTSWRYCHYDSRRNNHNADDEYRAKLIVYRRNSSTSDIYQPVTGSTTTILIDYEAASTFSCRTENLDEPFEIQENDVVGACIWDDGISESLLLVGTTTNASLNQNLYQFDKQGYQNCETDQLESIDTSDSNFILRDRWMLHLYANMGKYYYALCE